MKKIVFDSKEFSDYYRTHSKPEIAEHFHTSISRIEKEIKFLGLTKTKEENKAILKRIKSEQDSTAMVINLKKTMLKKYGVENYSQTREGKEIIQQRWDNGTMHKRIETNLKKYGVENYSQTEIRKKRVQEKWKDSSKVSEMLEKRNQTNLKKYGVKNPSKLDKTKECIKKTLDNTLKTKYGDIRSTFQIPEVKKKAVQSIMKKYSPEEIKFISKINRKWQQKIKEKTGIEFEFEWNNFDLTNHDHKICIEINPTFSHNTTFSYAYKTGQSKENKPVPQDYHYQKWLKARSLGYQLLSYFEWYDEDKFLDLIKAKLHKCENKIFARKCEIKEIKAVEARKFLEENHLQGYTPAKYYIGLFYRGELIQLVTFGKPRRRKDYEYELIRICSKRNWIIVGGASKLLSYFINTYKPVSIFSYENLDISTGKNTLPNFKFKEISPSFGQWVNLKNGKTISCASVLMRGASRMIGDMDFNKYAYGKANNEEIMIKEGYVKVYNCGNIIVDWFES